MNRDPEHREERQRTARLKREAATRSREWRERQRKVRAPDSRATNAAIAEAVAFFALKGLSAPADYMPGAAGPTMNLRGIAAAAAIILRRDGYSFSGACQRVKKALEPRSEHDSAIQVPTRSAVDGPVMLVPPRGADGWSAAELRLMRTFMTVGDLTSLGGK